MQKTPMSSAMYHGANFFAKENYRETTDAGFGCNGAVPDNRGASKYGRWLSRAPHLYPPGLPLSRCSESGKGFAAGFSVEKEQRRGYSALRCSR
jgi:hypothetical protein